MQSYDVRLCEQVMQSAELTRVAQRKLGHHIEENDVHAQPFSQHGKLGSNRTIAHDAQRFTANLVRIFC